MLLLPTLTEAFRAPAPRRATVHMTAPLDDDVAALSSRRKVVAAAMAGLSAEAAWRQAVAAATDAIEAAPATSSILPPGTIEQIDAGRAVVLNNWLTPEETAALRSDQIACLETGCFKEKIWHKVSIGSFFKNGAEMKNKPILDLSKKF